MAVGINAVAIYRIRFGFLIIVWAYKVATERIAPSCIEMRKVLKNAFSGTFRALAAIIRWAVEEIGKNSVMPSMRPKRME